MKFSAYDRVLIHALGPMSRHSLLTDQTDHQFRLRIMTAAADRATAGAEIMRPLITEAQRISDNRGRHSAIVHHVAHAMDEFDRMMMAVTWDKIRNSEHV